MVALAAALIATVARADVSVQFTSQNIATSTRTLRVPATGTIPVAGTALYLAVGVAISDMNHRVAQVRWVVGEPAQVVSALSLQTFRNGDNGTPNCRSEIWGRALLDGAPESMSGHVEITIESIAGTPPAPSLGASALLFRNVGSVSIDGQCCANSGNDGINVSTISKTMFGTSRVDALFNSVCVNWSGAMPGMPTADLAVAPEMVPRTYRAVTGPNLQHFAGSSPGADVARPQTGSRTLRWLQSGTRTWALSGLILFEGVPTPPPDAGVPDTGTPMGTGGTTMMGTGGTTATGGTSATGGAAAAGGASATGGAPAATGGTAMMGTGGMPPDGGPDVIDPQDAPVPDDGGDPADTDVAPEEPGGGGPGDDAARPIDGADPLAVDWRVGCACELGRGPASGPGVVVVLTLVLPGLRLVGLRRRRRDRSRQIQS